MKVLFDQGTPVPLRRHLHPHIVDTAAEKGWSRLQNRGLPDRAEGDRYHGHASQASAGPEQARHPRSRPHNDILAEDSEEDRQRSRRP